MFWNKEVENEIEQQGRENAGNHCEDDVADAEHPRAHFHPFAQSAKNTADDWRTVCWVVVTI